MTAYRVERPFGLRLMSLIPDRPLVRKSSGILRRADVPPIASMELSPIHGMSPSSPRNTLSLRCPCGYVKHDVMCLGDVVDKESRLFHFCGGLFVVGEGGVQCSKCRKTARCIEFSCAFCGRCTQIAVGRSMWMERKQLDDVHSTVVFSLGDIKENE